MSYRHPTLFWQKERLCCEYVLSLPSSELPLKLVSGPTAPVNRGAPRISALVLLGSPGSGHCRSGRCGQSPRSAKGHCETHEPALDKEQLKLFCSLGRFQLDLRRTRWPQNGPQAHAMLPQTAADKLSFSAYPAQVLLCSISEDSLQDMHACTPFLSRDHHHQQLPVRDSTDTQNSIPSGNPDA